MDAAYLGPMATFLGLTAIGSTWPETFPWVYIVKTAVAGLLLVVFARHYTHISWQWWWLGIIVGVLGIVQWVGMEKLLLAAWPNYPRMSAEVFNPFDKIHSQGLLWAFLFVRCVGPVLVVPFMEELFWRDYLWRTVAAPNDFRLAQVGEWDPSAFWVVAVLFASVHHQWLTALVWGAMIGLLLLRTRSLGACIIAHAVTNALLGAYVLWTQDWYFW